MVFYACTNFAGANQIRAYTSSKKEAKRCIVVYVDDLLIVGRKEEMFQSIADELNKHFQLSDLGDLKHYLGIQIERKGNVFYLNQENYIDKILKDVGMQDAKTSEFPLDPGYCKARTDNEQAVMPDSKRYQKLIGALLYIAVNTRPDIAASVTILSQFNKQPVDTDWTEAKRVLRYLKGTKDKRLRLGGQGSINQLIGFADASWAENRPDRKSNSGYIFQLFGGSISWGCRKQTCVALSSTEAEYVALAEACQEGNWIQRLLADMGHQLKELIVMYEDNQSCLKMLQNAKFSNKTKHIDTKYQYVNILYEKGVMKFEYCPTENMLADMMTKPLKQVKLKAMLERGGLID